MHVASWSIVGFVEQNMAPKMKVQLHARIKINHKEKEKVQKLIVCGVKMKPSFMHQYYPRSLKWKRQALGSSLRTFCLIVH